MSRNRIGVVLCSMVCLVLLALLVSVAAAQSTSDKADQVEPQIIKREEALVDAERHHDSEAFNRMLSGRLIYVAFNGWVFTKKDLISKMQYIDVEKYDPENFKVRLAGSDAALITYDLKAKATLAGHDFPHRQYISSLWVQTAGTWKLLFHQATPATHP